MSKSVRLAGKAVEVSRLQRASMAIENLAFLLKELKADQLFDAAEALALLSRSTSIAGVEPGKRGGDPNKQYLIGVLPRLLQDKELFPQNDDIVDFALVALGLEMNRSEKRSRYEIIGKVICETEFLKGKELSQLVRALDRAVSETGSFEELKSRKRSANFSWNETIQLLSRS